MVEYKCFRCGYVATQRCNFRNHLNRKNICKPILEDISIEEVKYLYKIDVTKNITVYNQVKPTFEQVKPAFEQVLTDSDNRFRTGKNQVKPAFSDFRTGKNQVKPAFSSNEIKCTYCEKVFTRQYGLTCHLKICKKKKECDNIILQQTEEISLMKMEIEELKKINTTTNNVTSNSNNNTNNTINNTININNYGDENLKHLRSKDFANLLNGIYSAVPKLIEKIHFDPSHPENQNIKYTNQKSPYLKIIKNNKWQFVSKKEELLDLIDNKCYMLKEKYYGLLKKKKYNITENQRNKIEEFMEKYHEDDKKMTLDLIERTELMLLNNS